ncbi:histidinol-phosphate transaminase [Heliophilum fasciatum]|uniref:Histidinol-phosphate aminotransferase n=1 Tax=Heliophilum fasciatum TaxID=35700 RepID=A0A4R2RWK9_9FIRM|nr:histidinol-phosphate transaminase [Heliophilum fasciatum]MCW2278019.1 histidinol-phosphate aminotransferase [Heliophilum fasciatum]TCP64361.1 histidinol phosphate aminotransferase [Heliophilum fasciatum]
MSQGPLQWVRADIRDIVPYQAKVYPDGAKLDANENPYPWPAPFTAQLQATLAESPLTRYPDGEARELRSAIAAYTGRHVDEILVSNGSDEAIQLMLLTFGGPGLATVIANPTFVMYGMATRYMGGKVIDVPLKEIGDTFALDVPGLLEAAGRPETRLVIICNPNNPTGNLFPVEDIEAVLRGTDKIVILDEAYYEFAQETLLPRLDEFPNLVVMRTFSKAFGLAGLRVGYTVASRSLIQEIHKVRQPFNVNTFSQTAAIVALQKANLFQEQVQAVLAERAHLLAALERFDWRVFRTDANYVFVRLPGTPVEAAQRSAKIYEGLLNAAVLVRKFGGSPSLDGTLRITVGQPAENARLIAALQAMQDPTGGWSL